jgi:hypothetical protein
MPRWVKRLLIALGIVIAASLIWLALNTLGSHGTKQNVPGTASPALLAAVRR